MSAANATTGLAALPCTTNVLIYPLTIYFFVTILAGPFYFLYLKLRDCQFSSRGGDKFGSASYDKDKKRFAVTAADESWGIDPAELKFVKVIGRGNMGEVYLGMWRGTKVAIKGMLGNWAKNEDMIMRFKAEIELMNKLHHPNILMFIGAVLDPGDQQQQEEVPQPGRKKGKDDARPANAVSSW
jgi:hypothetical protein